MRYTELMASMRAEITYTNDCISDDEDTVYELVDEISSARTNMAFMEGRKYTAMRVLRNIGGNYPAEAE